jgi:hypothetical protein
MPGDLRAVFAAEEKQSPGDERAALGALEIRSGGDAAEEDEEVEKGS